MKFFMITNKIFQYNYLMKFVLKDYGFNNLSIEKIIFDQANK
jgi:hypothetical protein